MGAGGGIVVSPDAYAVEAGGTLTVDAAAGLLDLKRLGDMLSRIQGRITHRELEHVSPLAVPVMLEIGRESVYGEAADELLAEAADELVKEAMG